MAMLSSITRRSRKVSISPSRWLPILLLAPSVLGMLILTIYPLVSGLHLTLVDFDLLTTAPQGQWNWFRNYTDLFRSKDFWDALRFTLTYTVSAVSLELLIGFGLAVLLTQRLPGRTIVRTAIISAMVMTPVIVGTAWRLMYNPGWGLLTYLLGQLGLPRLALLAQTSTLLPALVVVDVWEWSPLVMLILMAGLQSLPVEPYEAAQVDGATSLQSFRYITLPLLRPAIAIALLIRTMDCLRTFDTIFAMTGGGPGTASQNLNILSYYTGLEFYHMSSAATMAFIGLVLITLVCNLIVRVFGAELWRSRE